MSTARIVTSSVSRDLASVKMALGVCWTGPNHALESKTTFWQVPRASS